MRAPRGRSAGCGVDRFGAGREADVGGKRRRLGGRQQSGPEREREACEDGARRQPGDVPPSNPCPVHRRLQARHPRRCPRGPRRSGRRPAARTSIAIVVRRSGQPPSRMPMSAEYELVLMLDPETPDERRDQIAADARGRIESGGSLKAENAWGMRKLAYEIRQRTEADYRFFRFETESPVLDELDHSLKITDGVLRFRIFKVDPDSPVIEPPPPVPLAASRRQPPGRPSRSGSRPARRRRRPGGRARSARGRAAAAAAPPPAVRAATRRGGRAAIRRGSRPGRGGRADHGPGAAPRRPRPRLRPSKAADSAFRAPGGRERAARLLRLRGRANELRERADFQWLPASTGSSSPAT